MPRYDKSDPRPQTTYVVSIYSLNDKAKRRERRFTDRKYALRVALDIANLTKSDVFVEVESEGLTTEIARYVQP